MANFTVITGRIFNVNLRYTSNGKAVAQTSVSFKSGKDYSYLDVTLWEKNAERAAALTNGDDANVMVTLTGYLKQEKWESKKGEKRSKVVLNATEMTVVDTEQTFLQVGDSDSNNRQKRQSKPKKTQKAKPKQQEEEEEELLDNDDLPF